MDNEYYTIEELTNALFPNIYGNNQIKQAILLQLISNKELNVLIIGDPGTGKSLFIDEFKSIQNNNLLKVVDTDNAQISTTDNFCLIERIDAISYEFNLNSYMEKRNTFAVALPKFGRWDPYGDLASQINFYPSLISKFGLIFLLRDIPDKKRDELIVNSIYDRYLNDNIKIDQKYINYLNKLKELKITFSPEVLEEIKKYYIRCRNIKTTVEGYTPVAITARQVNSLLKITEAYAKLNNKTIAQEEEVKFAIDLVNYCLEQIGIDPRTGMLDIDRISSNLTHNDRLMIKNIIHTMKNIEQEKPDITFIDIIRETEKYYYENEDVVKILNNLKSEGIIFEPRKNIFKFLD